MQTPRQPSPDTPTLRDQPAAAEAPLSPPRGGTIGRYVLLDVLGRGGMGVVYAAFDPQLDRKVAIKVLRSRTGDESRDGRDRLLREAQAMARLAHPNVVAVYDSGTFEDNVFIVMELVEGTTLRGWLTAAGTERTWRARLEMMKAAGRGIAAAHAARIVHRDFKPDNVLVGRDGRARVTDFGIARSAPSGDRESALPASDETRRTKVEGGPSRAALESTLTATGGVLGTLGYMAPEQALGDAVDERSDQFSFCAALYSVLYGEKPFASDDFETYTAAVRRPPPSVAGDARVPTWIRRVILKGLAYAPQGRFSSMDALLDALERDPAVTRRRWIVAAASVVTLGIALTGSRFAVERKGAACRDAASLAGAWDYGVRRDVQSVFLATKAPGAGDAFERAARVLDGYAATWQASYVDACEAKRVRRDQTEDVYRLRTDCLERRRVELQALTALFRRADAAIVESSIKAAYGLPSVSLCSDVRALRANVGLPDDPAARARVVEVRSELAQAGALTLTDRNEEALTVARQSLALARQARHPGTEAEAFLVVGNAQARMVDEADAQRSLASAAWIGLESGELAVVVRASAMEAYIAGVEMQRGDEAQDWLERADAALARMGGNDELEAFVASRRASVLQSLEHRPELALPLFERVVETTRRLFGVHPNTERELLNLGNTYEALGRADLALNTYRESLSMAEQLYGPDSLRTGVSAAHVADAELKTGRPDEGTLVMERALDIFEHRGNVFWIVASLQDLTQAANRAGASGRALALGQRGLQLIDAGGASLPVLVPASCVSTADALLALGRAPEALPLCDRALAAQEQAKALDPEKVYEWDALRCRGEALLAAHRTEEAIASLERSVTLTRREWPGDLARARFALARALVDGRGDPTRARSLAREAMGELASRPELAAEAAVVTAWLAAHPGT